MEEEEKGRKRTKLRPPWCEAPIVLKAATADCNPFIHISYTGHSLHGFALASFLHQVRKLHTKVYRIMPSGTESPTFGRSSLKRAIRSPLAWLGCLLLLGLSAGGPGADDQKPHAQSPAVKSLGQSFGARLPFAAADLDGDHRPDVANVETDGHSAGDVDYRIQLKLSSTGNRSIQVRGPFGGLAIEARDVNGDNAVDLVVSSAYFGRPVAVLLNDGHGSFSRAAPSDFPAAFSSSKAFEAVSSAQLADAGGLPPQPRLPVCSDGSLYDARHCAARICGPRFAFVSNLLSSSLHGRAPPSKLLHS